jgi:hypothetical protein
MNETFQAVIRMYDEEQTRKKNPTIPDLENFF